MRRLLQVRMLIILLALALIPAATLPFAEQLRSKWTRFWEPEPAAHERELVETLDYGFPIQTPLFEPIVIEFSPMEDQRFDRRLIVPVEPKLDVPEA